MVVGGGGQRDPGPIKFRALESTSELNPIHDLGVEGAESPRVRRLRLGPGRPRAQTRGAAWAPRHTNTHTPSDGRPETQTHSRRRPDTFRQGHTSRRDARMPAATRPQRGPASAPARPQGGQPRRTPLPSCR